LFYSLVSAPVLGFDLVRRETGSTVAALLLGALEVGDAELPALAAAYDGRGDWQDDAPGGATTEGMTDALRTSTSLLATDRPADALSVLERASVVGPDGLSHFVRNDVFDWTWDLEGSVPVQSETAERAVAAVCAAVGAAYEGDLPTGHPVVERLLCPEVGGVLDAETRLGPCHDEVRTFLERLSALDGGDLEAIRRAADRSQRRRWGQGWADAVHSATWAAHLSDRIRQAARAQLHTVRVLADGPLSVTDLATGSWNLLSGAAQALVVRDLLDEGTTAHLVAPVTSALAIELPAP
jgi:hypothetical protein